MELKQVKNVVFDAGGVLVEWNTDRVLRQVFGDGEDLNRIKSCVYLHDDWHEFDRGGIDAGDLVENCSGRLGCEPAKMEELLQVTLESLLPIQGTLEIMDRLKQRDILMYMLSNMPAPTFDYLQDKGPYWEKLDGHVISAHVGLIKPHAEIYEHLLGKFQLAGEETVFFDDLEVNIEGARRVGIRGILFENPEQAWRDLEPLLA
ncbi:MAG: HAD family hydrolase [Candidatus Sumerlaeia bacterium]